MNTKVEVAIGAESTGRMLLRSGWLAVALSVPATFAAYVVGLLLVNGPGPIHFGELLAGALWLLIGSALQFLPIAAVVGLIIGVLNRRIGRTARLLIGTGLAVVGGGLVGWLLLHNAPAAPQGLAVRVVALAWGACSSLFLAFVPSRGETA